MMSKNYFITNCIFIFPKKFLNFKIKIVFEKEFFRVFKSKLIDKLIKRLEEKDAFSNEKKIKKMQLICN